MVPREAGERGFGKGRRIGQAKAGDEYEEPRYPSICSTSHHYQNPNLLLLLLRLFTIYFFPCLIPRDENSLKIRRIHAVKGYLVAPTQARKEGSEKPIVTNQATLKFETPYRLQGMLYFQHQKQSRNPCKHHVVEISASIHPSTHPLLHYPYPSISLRSHGSPACSSSRVDLIVPQPRPSPPPSPTLPPPSVSDSSPCPSSVRGNPTSHSVSPSCSSLLP